MERVTRREWLAATGAVAATTTGCLGLGGSSKPVTVGSLLPLSGPGALGQVAAHHERAVAAAVDHVNAAGGIHGREVEYVPKDTAASPDVAAEAYAELADEDAIGVVGAVISGNTASLTETAAEDGRPLVSPASTSPGLASAGRTDDAKFFGRTCPNDRQQAAVMAKVLDDEGYANAGTVSVLHLDDAFGAALADAVAGATDADVVSTVAFEASSSTPAEPVDAALADEPDAVAFVGTPGQSTSTRNELLERRYDGDVVLSSGLVPSNPSTRFDGAYTATVDSAQTVGTTRLTQELADIAPLMPYTTNAYDAAFLLSLAAEASDDASPAGVAANLRAVSGGVGHSVTVREFERAATLLGSGRAVNYSGASGPVNLNDDLEPLSSYLVERVDEGSVETLELLQRTFFGGGEA
ncbi:ABC transporter substrate-binding protein [Halobacterium litoreum]|uniref:ABC transporter substrate-binding protein n=1 Tax=Halobacterium litoreum TaxID=2039234 RepID=A0ABD5NDE7_9EURY|nr:ABC transporter substrate-binding protein [Halobacterium litoreum]UHH13803.1 ABC transporter substrate-binding protein [Halobacterium litoreum]